jgi:3-isopropylmalate/(R)-2-methylmalate dehydratase large subunit
LRLLVEFKIFIAAGFEIRQPVCSACLSMNDHNNPQGKYCVCTSNIKFEGMQQQGSCTILASPLLAAATEVQGKIVDFRKTMN